nr:MAG: nonstructural protein [Microvirus sp.]
MLIALSVFDKKAEFFGPPMFARNVNEGRRSFLDACNDAQSYLSKHPDDYVLYAVGTFDESTGLLSASSPAFHVADGSILIV